MRVIRDAERIPGNRLNKGISKSPILLEYGRVKSVFHLFKVIQKKKEKQGENPIFDESRRHLKLKPQKQMGKLPNYRSKRAVGGNSRENPHPGLYVQKEPSRHISAS